MIRVFFHPRRRALTLLLVLAILLIDVASKAWIHNALPEMGRSSSSYPYGGIGIFKSFLGIEFSIVHLHNTGAAWGLFQSYPDILVGARLVLVTGLFVYLLFGMHSFITRIGFTLVLAGALGNIIDYFVYGYVVDMLHFVLWGYDFPVFNIADSGICIGVGCLLLATFFDRKTLRGGG